MKRERTRWMLIAGLTALLTLLPSGCNSTQRSDHAAIASQDSTQGGVRSTAASDSPKIRWLLGDPQYNQWGQNP